MAVTCNTFPLPSPLSPGREGRGGAFPLANPRTHRQLPYQYRQGGVRAYIPVTRLRRERSLAGVPSIQGETTMRKTLGSVITAGAVGRRAYLSLAPAEAAATEWLSHLPAVSQTSAATSLCFRRTPETSFPRANPFSGIATPHVPPGQHHNAERVSRRRSPWASTDQSHLY